MNLTKNRLCHAICFCVYCYLLHNLEVQHVLIVRMENQTGADILICSLQFLAFLCERIIG